MAAPQKLSRNPRTERLRGEQLAFLRQPVTFWAEIKEDMT